MLKVLEVDYIGSHIIECLFNNGEKRRVDLTPLLKYPAYSDLKDESEFMKFGLDGTIFWSNGSDIAPEYLLQNGAAV